MGVSRVTVGKFCLKTISFQWGSLNPYSSVKHHFLEWIERTWKKNSYLGCEESNYSFSFTYRLTARYKIREPPVLQFHQDTKDWRIKG